MARKSRSRNSPKASAPEEDAPTPAEPEAAEHMGDGSTSDVDHTMSPRESRRMRREALRAKSAGYIAASATKSTKIVFDDDALEKLDEEGTGVENESHDEYKEDQRQASEEDDDDDVVEEVGGSKARQEAFSQRAEERQSKDEDIARKKSKRKRKQMEEIEQDFDEDFFSQVDAVRAEEKKVQASEKSDAPRGKRTVFVFAGGNNPESSTTRRVDDSIEVSVLHSEASRTTKGSLNSLPIEPLSKSATRFARSSLDHGYVHPTQGGCDWKRSRKMNLLLASRKKGRGKRSLSLFKRR